jgi:hypothetical protein
MSYPFTDSFNRANENPLNANWGGFAAYPELKIAPGSTGQMACPSNSGTDSFSVLTAAEIIDEVEVQYTFADALNGNSYDHGSCVHVDSANGNQYVLEPVLMGSHVTTIYKMLNSSWGTGAVTSCTYHAVVGDVFNFKIVKITGGYELTVSANKNYLTSYVDKPGLSAGRVGIYAYQGKIINFGASSTTGSPSTPYIQTNWFTPIFMAGN